MNMFLCAQSACVLVGFLRAKENLAFFWHPPDEGVGVKAHASSRRRHQKWFSTHKEDDAWSLSAVNNERERVGEYYWENSSSRHHIDRRANDDDDDGTKLTLLEDVDLTLKKTYENHFGVGGFFLFFSSSSSRIF